MDWYISSEMDTPLGRYEIPLPERKGEKRIAFCGLNLTGLLNIDSINIFQEWYVILYIDNKEYARISFYLKDSNAKISDKHTLSSSFDILA